MTQTQTATHPAIPVENRDDPPKLVILEDEQKWKLFLPDPGEEPYSKTIIGSLDWPACEDNDFVEDSDTAPPPETRG